MDIYGCFRSIHDFSFFWDNHRCRVLQKILCVHPQWLKSVNDWQGIRKQLVQQKYRKLKDRRNPTCQLLPKSSQRKVKMGWERQEREKRWWRIGVCKKCMSKWGVWKSRVPCKSVVGERSVCVCKGVVCKSGVCERVGCESAVGERVVWEDGVGQEWV